MKKKYLQQEDLYVPVCTLLWVMVYIYIFNIFILAYC